MLMPVESRRHTCLVGIHDSVQGLHSTRLIPPACLGAVMLQLVVA
jgi:hypothetical protein